MTAAIFFGSVVTGEWWQYDLPLRDWPDWQVRHRIFNMSSGLVTRVEFWLILPNVTRHNSDQSTAESTGL